MADEIQFVIVDERTQEFCGNRYYLNSLGYYRRVIDHKEHLIHVDIWEFFYGKIPEGYEIHHCDGDKSNNALKNLQCLTKAEHTRLHQLERPLVKTVCSKCGKVFFTRSLKATLCSNRCRRAAWVDKHQEERICVICGKKFLTYYERDSKTCSPTCRSKLVWQKRKHLSAEERKYIRQVYKPRDKKFGGTALACKYGVTPETIRCIVNEQN